MQPFHNDMGSDIISLLVRECAVTGGGTYLASSWTAHNDLVENDPKALDALLSNSWPIQVYAPLPHTSLMTMPAMTACSKDAKANSIVHDRSGDSKFIKCPLMKHYDNKLLTSVDPNRLGPHPSSKAAIQGVPELTPEQRTALEALDKSATKNEILVPLKKGDILFLNNWAIMHRRESYEDGAITSRHLLRLWIRNTKLGWAVPKEMAEPWEHSFERAGVKKVYSPEPPVELREARYSAGSAAFIIDDTEEE